DHRRAAVRRARGRAARAAQGAGVSGARDAGVARGSALRPYAAVVGARFRMLLQYRAAAIAGLWTQIIFGLVLIMIYEGFYGSSAADARPMAFAQLVSYVWLGQALLAMLPWNVDAEIQAMVRGGAVAYELCRPI